MIYAKISYELILQKKFTESITMLNKLYDISIALIVFHFFFTILVLLVEIMFDKLNGISFALIRIQFYNIGIDGKMCVPVLINYMIFPLH